MNPLLAYVCKVSSIVTSVKLYTVAHHVQHQGHIDKGRGCTKLAVQLEMVKTKKLKSIQIGLVLFLLAIQVDLMYLIRRAMMTFIQCSNKGRTHPKVQSILQCILAQHLYLMRAHAQDAFWIRFIHKIYTMEYNPFGIDPYNEMKNVD